MIVISQEEGTAEEGVSSLRRPGCCCPCCCPIVAGGENQEGGENPNWWKKRRKMKTRKTYETKLLNPQIQKEQEKHNYDNDNDPVQRDGYLPSESGINETHEKSESNSALRRENLICGDNIKTVDQIFPSEIRRNSKVNYAIVVPSSSHHHPLVTLINLLVILVTFLLVISSSPFTMVNAFPTNDCDWTGSGTPENVVQAIYLRCQQGQILWERPRGGLRVNISPPKYFVALGQEDKPFRLCLESNVGTNFQVFLEQTDDISESSSENGERRKLLPFITPKKKKSSTCYRINSPTATIYVESQHGEQDLLTTSPPPSTTTTSGSKDPYQVKISYEIEELKIPHEGFSDDECRPCSDPEVLQLYCEADVVARGEILSVLPSTTRKGMDNLHIKSNLVVHQNHPVFQPLKPGNKNLQKFLLQDTPTFDQDSPKKVPKLAKSLYFGGIVSHPSKCAAQSGPGQFLWLIKLSFGRPKIGCVVYWDRWMQVAKQAEASDKANCRLVYQ